MTEPLTVLLVDDDISILTSIYRVLEEEGYSVLAAGNGVDALDICRQSRHPIDLLLTDVAMPEMSGFELAERALLLQPLMKILFMSGDTGEETRHSDDVPGVRLFLAKPFNWVALVHKLRAAVGSYPHRASSMGRDCRPDCLRQRTDATRRLPPPPTID